MSRKRVTILGSTGSIGCNAVDLVRRGDYEVIALTGGANVGLLAEQARALRPGFVAIQDEALLPDLRDALSGTGVQSGAGDAAIIEAAARGADWRLAAIAGAAGLRPTLAAAGEGGVLALANKESLVCAGDLVKSVLARSGGTLLPVDSEHNAIFQCFETAHLHAIERLILTASGGPFRDWPRERMRAVTPEQAVAHPNWSMGVKISIDSATMFNKGLELIEAAHLFPVAPSAIEILVHPQSVIHSMVGYSDGSVLAQLGCPDMRTPIAYALGWPERIAAPVERLDLAALSRLDFEAPDEERFPALRISRAAMAAGGLAPCIMNGAKEAALDAFLTRRIGFLDIAPVVEDTLSRLGDAGPADTLDAVLEADARARKAANSCIAAAA